jgi:hypothetical protein
MRDQPAVPTLDAVVAALTAVTGKRKTLVFLGPGVPIEFSATIGCPGNRATIMKDVFRKAQRASINIHTIDPAGYNGYEQYMERYRIRNGPPGIRRQPPGGNARELRLMQDFLKVVAENTGGRFVLDTDAVLSGIDRILEEETSYYLLGYEASNNTADGKFRKIQVKVNQPGVSIRHRSGYWALDPGAVVARDRSAFNPLLDFDPRDAGLTGPPGVVLRAAASAIAIARLPADPIAPTGRSSPRGGAAAPAGPLADVVVALAVRWPAIHAPVAETLTIIRTIYDPDGRAGDPVRETVTMTLDPGLEGRRELIRRVSLPPGRHQLRFSVASTLLNKNGSVYVDVEVPDFSRSALALSNVVLGSLSPVEGVPPDAILGNPRLLPTSNRDFANGDRIGGYVHVNQAGVANPVTMTVEVIDAADHRTFMESRVLGAEVFDADGGASYQVALPLDQFKPGPYLLSVAARLPNGRTARRDLVFRVR